MKNCLSCGAPLSGDNPVCSYCGVLQPIDLSLLAPITVIEKQTPNNCPDCKTPLQSIRVSVKHDRVFQSCPQCYGLGVSTQELPAILDAMVQYVFHVDAATIDALVKAHPLKTAFHYRPCPVCGVLMNRHNCGERSAVIVDFCAKDDLTWFNDGDLQKLCEWRKAGGQILDTKVKEEHTLQELRQELYVLEARLDEDSRHQAVISTQPVERLWEAREQDDRMKVQKVRNELAQFENRNAVPHPINYGRPAASTDNSNTQAQVGPSMIDDIPGEKFQQEKP